MANLAEKKLAKMLSEAEGKSDAYASDGGARGAGTLVFRACPNKQGIFYFRYTASDGKRDLLPIGFYDEKGEDGFTLRDARRRAGEYSRRYQDGARDLRAHLEQEEADRKAKLQAEKRARDEAERMATAGTLRNLLEAYAEHLEHGGKQSAYDARNIFDRHVFDAYRGLAAKRASEITRADCNTVLSRLIEAGKGRTAAKLRSYGRSAFNLALQADSDPTVPPALRGFAIEANPWASVPAKSFRRFNRPLDRALSESELRAYMKALEALPAGATKRGLWLHLRLGGQRPKQLVRATPADVDMDAGTITLRDPKGAREQPRVHVLPLPKQAAAVVAEALRAGERAIMRGKGKSAEAAAPETPRYLLTNDGKRPLRAETMSKAVAEIAAGMLEKKTARAPFALRDIRRTCETMLAAMAVSSDVRAQLQSHGLGGIQQRHYDRHDYMKEKRHALDSWERRLERISAGKRTKSTNPKPSAGKRPAKAGQPSTDTRRRP